MSDTSQQRDPYQTFRPVRGAWVAGICAVASVVIFTLVAIFSPSYAGASEAMSLLNRVAIFLLGLAIAAFLSRYVVLRAEPSSRGLKVVNLFRTYEVSWSQILNVGFTGESAWAMLELTDTENLAVMAIQRSDGDRAAREASRLAALVEHHQRGTCHDDR